jgi:hypothetical protein
MLKMSRDAKTLQELERVAELQEIMYLNSCEINRNRATRLGGTWQKCNKRMPRNLSQDYVEMARKAMRTTALFMERYVLESHLYRTVNGVPNQRLGDDRKGAWMDGSQKGFRKSQTTGAFGD